MAAVAGLALLGLLTAASGGWGVLALTYSGPHNDAVRNTLAAAFAIVSLAALIALGLPLWRWRALAVYLVLFAVLVTWWRGIEPSNERDWQADVAVPPYATIEGDELYYVVADERDVIRLRTNYRRDPPEDVYVYRTRGPTENGRRLFLEYLDRINALKARPEFYNTLTTNCTTNIWLNSRVNPAHLPSSWKILASINSRARAADPAADFSRRIRALDTAQYSNASQMGGK